MIRQRDYSTLYMQQTGLIPGYIQHHQYLTDNSGVIDNKREIFQSNETHEILLTVDYWQWTAVQLITDAYTQTCVSRHGYDSWEYFINKWKTMNNSWRIKVQRVTSIRHVFCYSFQISNFEGNIVTWPSVRPREVCLGSQGR